MYQILVCDEMKDVLSALSESLREEGYRVEETKSKEEAIDFIRHKEIHLVLMNWIPSSNCGVAMIQAIRELSNVPVILISSSDDEHEKILGLNSGADDYVSSPFNTVEILARVNSQLRRYMHLGCRSLQNKQFRVGDLLLNDQAKNVTVRGELVSLTPLEYDILALLMKSPGRVFTSKEIYRIVWNAPPMGAENAVAVHIRHIREKIEPNPAQPQYLRVVWGKGYKIQNED